MLVAEGRGVFDGSVIAVSVGKIAAVRLGGILVAEGEIWVCVSTATSGDLLNRSWQAERPPQKNNMLANNTDLVRIDFNIIFWTPVRG